MEWNTDDTGWADKNGFFVSVAEHNLGPKCFASFAFLFASLREIFLNLPQPIVPPGLQTASPFKIQNSTFNIISLPTNCISYEPSAMNHELFQHPAFPGMA
jgi:hypothetical protein